MAILNLIFRTLRGKGDEFGSLEFWMNKMKRNTNMWNFPESKIKNFHACEAFLDHLVESHVLAAVAADLGVDNYDALCQELATKNWRKIIHRIAKRFESPTEVGFMRKVADGSRDYVYENAALLLQQGLIYQRFHDAITTGDSGWIRHCLKIMTIWLQNNEKATSLKNYRRESINLMACFQHIWSKK